MDFSYVIVPTLVFLMSCGDNHDRSDAYGNFETEETIVSSETAGKLIRFSIELGDQVKQGELLAVADTSQFSLQLSQLKAQRQSVAVKKISTRSQADVLREQIRNLKIDQDRIQKLFADKAATQKQVDDIDGQMRVLKKQLESLNTQFVSIDSETHVLDAQLAVVKDRLQKCFIHSPLTGIVMEKYVEQGEVVSPGKAVVKLGDLSELDLRVFMSGAQLPEIRLGQQVEVLIDRNRKSNQALSGKISWISPEAEFTPKIIQTKEERVKLVYAVKVKVKNDGRLKIGMPGEVRLKSERRTPETGDR